MNCSIFDSVSATVLVRTSTSMTFVHLYLCFGWMSICEASLTSFMLWPIKLLLWHTFCDHLFLNWILIRHNAQLLTGAELLKLQLCCGGSYLIFLTFKIIFINLYGIDFLKYHSLSCSFKMPFSLLLIISNRS